MDTIYQPYTVVRRVDRQLTEIRNLALPWDLLLDAWGGDPHGQQAIVDFVELALGPTRDRRKRVRWSQLTITPS